MSNPDQIGINTLVWFQGMFVKVLIDFIYSDHVTDFTGTNSSKIICRFFK